MSEAKDNLRAAIECFERDATDAYNRGIQHELKAAANFRQASELLQKVQEYKSILEEMK
jgi:hypothetical protein